jgi:hypothetical protein
MTPELASHVTRLFDRDDWPQVALIGTLLVLAAQYLLPAVLLAGYAVRVLRTAGGADAPYPSFEDLGALARDGAAAATIVAAYHVPALVAFAGTARYAARKFVYLPNLSTLTGSSASVTAPGTLVGGNVTAAPLVVVGLLLTVGLAVAGGYVATAALLRYARTDSVRAGFDPRAVRALAGSGGFLRTWLVAVGLLALVRFAAGLLTVVPAVGAVAAATVTFVATCAVLGLTAAMAPSPPSVRVGGRDGPTVRQTA